MVTSHIDGKYTPEPNSGCWLWTYHTNSKGYGVVKVNKKDCKAHRISFQEFVGDIPDGAIVMHTCDNPSCVNPRHLRIGTYSDNTRDMYLKNRFPLQKINAEVANKIYEDCKLMKQKDVAEKYGVGFRTVSAIATGKTWSYINKGATL